MTAIKTINPVGWFEIYVKDMKRAKLFYDAVFAVTLEKLENPGPELSEMYAFSMDMDAKGASGALVKMDGGPAGDGGTIVYFTCENCATESGRVEKNGGKIIKPKFSIGKHGHIALVSDTEGNVIGLHSMK